MSAGDGYKVDLGELEEVGRQLHALADAVKDEAISKLDCEPSAFGHTELARAAANHADKWQRGVMTLSEDAAEVANRLKASAHSYLKHEEDAASIFKNILLPKPGQNG